MHGCIGRREVVKREKRSTYIKRLGLFFGGMMFLTIWNESLQALEEQPWFYPPWQFHVKGIVDVNFFQSVDNGYNPFDYHSTNEQVTLGFLVPFRKGDFEIELELENTSKYTFGVESAAFQMRRSILDDIVGDWISFDIGGNVRAVPGQRLSDVAVPYHNLWNFEFVTALGREWSKQGEWWLRSFVSAAVGQANRGYPWFKANFDIQGKAFNAYVVEAFFRSYFGIGHYTLINVDTFNNGYGMFKHQNVDVGITFSFLFKVMGKLKFLYAHRFYARTFPTDYNEFQLSWDVPFSF